MGCTYVKDFDYGTKGKDGTVKYAMGGKVQAPGFKGQNMHRDNSTLGIKGNKNPGIKPGGKPVAPDLPTLKLARGGAPRVEAMDKREMAATPTMRRESAMTSRKVQAPARRGVPVAAREPMIGMKTGGKVSQAKVGKVMGEFKAGELHSGSKTGPVVKNPKQAVAIALSEGRKATKR